MNLRTLPKWFWAGIGLSAAWLLGASALYFSQIERSAAELPWWADAWYRWFPWHVGWPLYTLERISVPGCEILDLCSYAVRVHLGAYLCLLILPILGGWLVGLAIAGIREVLRPMAE